MRIPGFFVGVDATARPVSSTDGPLNGQLMLYASVDYTVNAALADKKLLGDGLVDAEKL